MNKKNYLPNHIAIIPDGNRRWAKEKRQQAFEGHRYAAQTTLPNLVDEFIRLGIKYFSFWALSTENLTTRSKIELNNLFSLMRYFLKSKYKEFKEKKIRIKVIGDLNKLPEDLQREISKISKESLDNEKLTIILGLNYGGRDEIIRAIKKIPSFAEASAGKQNSKITKESFSEYLDTSGIPDPDLIIRTGGEKRLSGFMLWQSEYSELYFSNLYFPDFTAEELKKAVKNYGERQRRFGK
ncbi:di-trans,poly-cis-decaprenylcistransferase [Candidatus Roizmanbacteria bacterium CG11_big_fil_rev_8_21_14_0_20_35_14]|uniref:Isoprenyl transferase n=1 Tax=Candidatus Roizmanbacteria bacterium CG11_big_fil_rev_8_21_14_0_20_35_14 TaxID=1974855 RepID=A0A2H0KNB0_9BACT|nr:MAG: di-trans,poly-cis-decaprenylcistransferase [Candidatus Roizmanbacteria bacterium CG11_big_fil_rev_8_21_14_0_20_35_14]